jgi:trimeric autotransporter adhesin
MPLSSFRRLSAIGFIGAVALAAAACGSSSSSSTTASASGTTTASTSSSKSSTTTTASAPATVVGKKTDVVVNPKVSASLKHAGITVTGVAPATAKTTWVFPIKGGKIVVATLVGTVNDTGGLTFSHSGKSVTLTNPLVNTSTKQLTATVDGQSVPIFDLNLASLKRASGPHGSVVASDIKLTVTSQAASTLNSGLGVSTFTGGMQFGIATLTVAVKS